MLSQKGDDVLRASIECCEVISAKFARQANSTMGKTSVQASQRSKAYADLARRLRRRAVSSSAPIAGGIQGEPIFDKGIMDLS